MLGLPLPLMPAYPVCRCAWRLQGKRGLEKPPFKLPEFIEATGIGKAGGMVGLSAFCGSPGAAAMLGKPCVLGRLQALQPGARLPARRRRPYPLPPSCATSGFPQARCARRIWRRRRARR